LSAGWPQLEVDVVSDFEFSARGGAPVGGGGGSLRGPEDVVARAQRLIDSPQPYDGYPLEWHFEALNVGDLTAIATMALRASRSDSGSDTV
jgi:hypothetical protein